MMNIKYIAFNIILLTLFIFTGALCWSAACDVEDTPANDILWAAATEGNSKKLTYALKNGAHINAILLTGYTALMEAICKRHYRIATQLLQHPDINVNVATKNGITALQLAAVGNYELIVMMLLERKAVADVADKYGNTALTWATRNDNQRMIKLLTDKVVAQEVEIAPQ